MSVMRSSRQPVIATKNSTRLSCMVAKPPVSAHRYQRSVNNVPFAKSRRGRTLYDNKALKPMSRSRSYVRPSALKAASPSGDTSKEKFNKTMATYDKDMGKLSSHTLNGKMPVEEVHFSKVDILTCKAETATTLHVLPIATCPIPEHCINEEVTSSMIENNLPLKSCLRMHPSDTEDEFFDSGCQDSQQLVNSIQVNSFHQLQQNSTLEIHSNQLTDEKNTPLTTSQPDMSVHGMAVTPRGESYGDKTTIASTNEVNSNEPPMKCDTIEKAEDVPQNLEEKVVTLETKEPTRNQNDDESVEKRKQGFWYSTIGRAFSCIRRG